MKKLLLAAALCLVSLEGSQANEATLNLEKGDIDRVQIEVSPGKKPRLVIYFGIKKLIEAQVLASNNKGKPLALKMNETTVVKPVISNTLLSRGKMTLSFPDLDSAVAATKLLVPGK